MKKDYQFDQAISDLNKAVSTTKANNFLLPPPNIIYKYFIGKGNNSIMVRSLFKNRYWWVQHDKEEMEKCNFCWT
jgi:tubulin polyglutamylase TTLL1/tubulin monoglycylase TTLL3/8